MQAEVAVVEDGTVVVVVLLLNAETLKSKLKLIPENLENIVFTTANLILKLANHAVDQEIEVVVPGGMEVVLLQNAEKSTWTQ